MFAGRVIRKVRLCALALLLTSTVSQAQTNYWTNSASGNWEDLFWSLGVLPDITQSVAIVNTGAKTVTINSVTAQNHPESLAVDALTVGGGNSLILNHVGTNIPLRALGILISSNATLLNFESGLIVENSLFVWNGKLVQDGGFVCATNTSLDNNGAYHLTNGAFQGGAVWLGNANAGHFHQYGGRANMATLDLVGHYGGSRYYLYGGDLRVGRLRVSDYGDAFFHQGGTNRTLDLEVGPSTGPVNYFLSSGLLCTSNVLIAVGISESTFEQTGGSHIITNTLRLEGSGRNLSRIPARYILANGSLSARFIQIEGSVFDQTNGTTTIAESLQFNTAELGFIGTLFLRGGTFACANVSHGPIGADFVQTGGALIVTNLFSFGGYYNAPFVPRYPQYDFSGGTLTASNIDLTAEMIIGSAAQTGRITNAGYFKMAGTLTVGDADEQLGRFTLASNATINLGGGNAKLSFSNSSGEDWNSATILTVTNWNGSSTGGGDDQLRFGESQSGITATQVHQIRFINPLGFPTGDHLAQILNTGEVVPLERPMLARMHNGNRLVFNWLGNFSLQMSTNIAGPYVDIPGASSPYTNEMTGSSERYFRLRQ